MKGNNQLMRASTELKHNLAPIVLFVYNRPDHTKKTIEALQKNELANESELFMYSDAAKNESVVESVSKVRQYIKTIDGFKKITIIEREKNWGLADSIIDGVTQIVNQYGKIIVLEDDIVTSPYFLKFMNEALEFYKNEDKVWHISGWNFPIKTKGLDDIFFYRLMYCWGWATWKSKWKYYEKNIDRVLNGFTQEEIYDFNLANSEDFWGQVVANKTGEINSWAVFWYATIFKQNGLCLNPSQSFVLNIGNDGTGIHCPATKSYNTIISMNKNIKFSNQIEENYIALKRVMRFYKLLHRFTKKPFVIRVINKLSRYIIKRNIFN